jgi:hypothetical protein
LRRTLLFPAILLAAFACSSTESVAPSSNEFSMNGTWRGSAPDFELAMSIDDRRLSFTVVGSAIITKPATHEFRILEVVFPWGPYLRLDDADFSSVEYHFSMPDKSTMTGYLVKYRNTFTPKVSRFDSFFTGDSVAIVLRR